jgi:hypothetical protein
MVNEDDGNRAVIQGMLEESIPVADKVIDPPWADEESWNLFGVSQEETHAFAHLPHPAAPGDRASAAAARATSSRPLLAAPASSAWASLHPRFFGPCGGIRTVPAQRRRDPPRGCRVGAPPSMRRIRRRLDPVVTGPVVRRQARGCRVRDRAASFCCRPHPRGCGGGSSVPSRELRQAVSFPPRLMRRPPFRLVPGGLRRRDEPASREDDLLPLGSARPS